MTAQALHSIAVTVLLVWLGMSAIARTGDPLARDIAGELRPVIPAVVGLFVVAGVGVDGGYMLLPSRLIAAGIIGAWWWVSRNDDDRWKRRRQRMAERVASVGGRLRVVPAVGNE